MESFSVQTLPFSRKLAYASGMLGWSILINTISVMLVYFYLPPAGQGLESLIPQYTFLGIFTAMALIAASGRIVDAISDPLIGFYSDKSQHPKGRRLPFMLYAIIPAAIFYVLMFLPPNSFESDQNIYWLTGTQFFFFLALTLYIIPYNALLPELGHNSEEKLSLSTWQSAAFVVGIIISSQIPFLSEVIQPLFDIPTRLISIQYTIAGLSIVAALFMWIPVGFIDEKKYCDSIPSSIPLKLALRQTLSNRNFLIFILADFPYFTSLALITSGLLYYVESMLGLPGSVGGWMMGTMVLTSLCMYPLANYLARKWGKKPLIVISFFILAGLFLCIYFLGRLPIPVFVQAFGLMVLMAFPVACMGILPVAIVADIAEADGIESGQKKEGMFFAIRTLFNKFGQTIGIMLFAILTLYGKDPGADLGLRMSGLIGSGLCISAGLLFLGFKEPNPRS